MLCGSFTMVGLGWGSSAPRPRQRSHGLAASELGGVPSRTGPWRLVALLLCLSCPWTVACGKGHVSVAAGGVRGTLVGPMEAGAPHLRSDASRHSRPSAPAHRMQLPGPHVELRAV